MKITNKKLLVLVACLILFGIISLMFVFNVGGITNSLKKNKEINCDLIPFFFIKPEERVDGAKMAKRVQGIAIIPETNELITQTEVIQACPDLNIKDYLDLNFIEDDRDENITLPSK